MPFARGWVARIAIGAAGAVLAFLLGAYAVLLQTVPSPSGFARIGGLIGAVEVVRDGEGVPHVFAQSMGDGLAALGFVHAQDRLWQMESARRLVQGRLAEILGPALVDTDVFMRTLDLDGHAKRSLGALPADVRANLEAYARGVNAFLARDTGPIEPRFAPEFLVLGHRPEPWQAADCIGVIKLLALLLSNNLGHEMRRLRLAALGLAPAEIVELMPSPDGVSAPPLPDLGAVLPLRRLIAQEAAPQQAMLADSILGSGASNNWVLSGSRTESGKPLLANDPHLRVQVPSVWYFAHVSVRAPGATPFDAVGGTVPGAPIMVLGHSGALAWGFTNTGADVQDLFIEKVNPANPDEYLTPDGWRRFEEEQETVRVRGGAQHTFVRRRTRHGPVMPDRWRDIGRLLAPGHVAALAWTALSDDDTTIAAGLSNGEVATVAAFMARQRFYVVPMQSMVVADRAGSTGLIAPGRVPVRDPANAIAGRAPVPGWDARYDWKGFIAFEDLPRVIDPPSGAIATANARIVGPDYRQHLTHDWEHGWRQRRIDELLAAAPRHDAESMRAAQLDVVSLPGIRLKALMVDAVRPLLPAETAMLDMLAGWDGAMVAARPEPLVFEAWLREAVRGLWQDDLGREFERFWEPNADAVIGVLEGRATARDWCDDRRSPEVESCAQILARALVMALGELSWQQGPRRQAWRWGDVHVADGEHRLFSALGLGWLANIRPPTPGGQYTLNRGATDYAARQPFANSNAASMRAVYDMSDLSRSKFIHFGGQSGNPLSRHYADFAERWARGDYIEIATDRAAVMRAARGVWRFEGK